MAITIDPSIGLELTEVGILGRDPFGPFQDGQLYIIALSTTPAGAAGAGGAFVARAWPYVKGAARWAWAGVTAAGGAVIGFLTTPGAGAALAQNLSAIAKTLAISVPLAYAVGRVVWLWATGPGPQQIVNLGNKLTDYANRKIEEATTPGREGGNGGGTPPGPHLSGLDLALILGVVLAVALILEG